MKNCCATFRAANILKASPAAVLVFLLISSGCRKKQPVQTIVEIDIALQPVIRVLLEENITQCSFESSSPFDIECPGANISKANFEKPKEATTIELRNGGMSLADWVIPAGQINIRPGDGTFTLNGQGYRGDLQIVLTPDANHFDVVNYVAVEPYLAGVIAAEMPGYWELEALKAQTIAARTYCLYIKERFGQDRHWDLRKTQANQVYRGIAAESNRIWQVVNQTAGLVLVCKDSKGNESIFPAYYGSVCAGHTENSKNVFGDSFEALVGVLCPYCKTVAKPKMLYWPTVNYKKSEVSARLIERYPSLKGLGGIKTIRALEKSDYKDLSRVTKVELVGANCKTDWLRGEDFRLAIDPTGLKIKSAAFEIRNAEGNWSFAKGKGFGHGVGLCQCGAEALARKKKTAAQIIEYYYPNSKMKKIY